MKRVINEYQTLDCYCTQNKCYVELVDSRADTPERVAEYDLNDPVEALDWAEVKMDGINLMRQNYTGTLYPLAGSF